MTELLFSKNVKNLPETIELIVKQYISSIPSGEITNLYDMILEQVEPPLFLAVMKHCRYNQNKAASILGLSRPTCRRKLVKYFDDRYCE